MHAPQLLQLPLTSRNLPYPLHFPASLPGGVHLLANIFGGQPGGPFYVSPPSVRWTSLPPLNLLPRTCGCLPSFQKLPCCSTGGAQLPAGSPTLLVGSRACFRIPQPGTPARFSPPGEWETTLLPFHPPPLSLGDVLQPAFLSTFLYAIPPVTVTPSILELDGLHDTSFCSPRRDEDFPTTPLPLYPLPVVFTQGNCQHPEDSLFPSLLACVGSFRSPMSALHSYSAGGPTYFSLPPASPLATFTDGTLFSRRRYCITAVRGSERKFTLGYSPAYTPVLNKQPLTSPPSL